MRLLLLLSLVVCVPIYFENVWEYSVPMGYAGMYTQMAKQIAENNFWLPFDTAFYGPGGIPFAYPPLGFYFLAILIKLTGKYFVFLRLLPALIALLAMIPLFYLTLELTSSRWAAVSSVVIAVSSVDLYIDHVWAAGIVRAPAFLFMLLALYFFTRQCRTPSRRLAAITGIFLGLCILTHWEYAVFCLGWLGFWTLWGGDFWVRAKNTLFSCCVGFIISVGWLATLVSRYGVSVYINAFNSHGNTQFMANFGNLGGLWNLMMDNLAFIRLNEGLAVLALVGIIFLWVKKKFALPLFFLLCVLVFRGGGFGFLTACFLAGIGIAGLTEQFPRFLPAWGKTERGTAVSGAVLALPFLAYFWWHGWSMMTQMQPVIDVAIFDLVENIPPNLAPDETYLALITQDEAEWMPFLFQREPLVAQWGSEWLGTYDEQTYRMSLFRDCRRDQDWVCVEQAIEKIGQYPDSVITYIKDRKLNEQIASTHEWQQVYENKRYMIWQR